MKINEIIEAHGPWDKKTAQDLARIEKAKQREQQRDKPGQLTRRPMPPGKARNQAKRDQWTAKTYGEDQDLEEWRPDRAWCEKTPVRKQGASNTSSCRSQGFTARDSEVRVRLGRAVQKIGDRRIKGRKYGGPLPDYSD